MNERGWVIERPCAGGPAYWDGHAADSFSTDNTCAIRFARRADAEIVLSWAVVKPPPGEVRITEHAWRREHMDWRGQATGGWQLGDREVLWVVALENRLAHLIAQVRAEQREMDAKIAEFWGECECGSGMTMRDIAAAIREEDKSDE